MRPVDGSTKLYQALLRAYPAPFRQRYGEEMTLVFGELTSDAWDRGGWPGLASVWLRVVVDLARTVPQQHYSAWQGAPQMQTRLPIKTAALACISIAATFWLNTVLFAVLNLGLMLVALLHVDFHYQHWPPTEVLATFLPPFFLPA